MQPTQNTQSNLPSITLSANNKQVNLFNTEGKQELIKEMEIKSCMPFLSKNVVEMLSTWFTINNTNNIIDKLHKTMLLPETQEGLNKLKKLGFTADHISNIFCRSGHRAPDYLESFVEFTNINNIQNLIDMGFSTQHIVDILGSTIKDQGPHVINKILSCKHMLIPLFKELGCKFSDITKLFKNCGKNFEHHCTQVYKNREKISKLLKEHSQQQNIITELNTYMVQKGRSCNISLQIDKINMDLFVQRSGINQNCYNSLISLGFTTNDILKLSENNNIKSTIEQLGSVEIVYKVKTLLKLKFTINHIISIIGAFKDPAQVIEDLSSEKNIKMINEITHLSNINIGSIASSISHKNRNITEELKNLLIFSATYVP